MSDRHVRIPPPIQLALRQTASVVSEALDNGAIGGGVVWTAGAADTSSMATERAKLFVTWVTEELGAPICPFRSVP